MPVAPLLRWSFALFGLLGGCTYPLLRSRPLRVPPLRRLTLEKRQSKQNALTPPLGASPRLGMPAVRHCSVGPPRSAIHGRVAATPASMPGCPLRNTCLRPSWFNGAPEIKIKSQIKSRATATAKPGCEAAFPCGSWLACDGGPIDRHRVSGTQRHRLRPSQRCGAPTSQPHIYNLYEFAKG